MTLLSVENYKEMLQKLATYAFIVGCTCVLILRANVDQIDALLAVADVEALAGLTDFLGIPLIQPATAMGGALTALLSHVFKWHDRLSSLLRLRNDFDIYRILIPMALLSGAQVNHSQLKKLKSEKDRLMNEVFYEYASSSAGRQVIDPHIITQALTNWSWYWVCLESSTFLVATAITLGIFGQWKASALVLFVCFTLILVMRWLKSESSKYAAAQVNDILSSSERKAAIKTVFNAL